MHRRDLRRCLSVGVASVRRFLFLLAFFSMPAFSVPYYWTLDSPAGWPGGNVLTGTQFKTPDAACAAGASAYDAGPTGWQVTGHSVSYVSATSYRCTLSLRYPSNGSTTTSAKSINRGGTECVSPAVYNASTGLCDAPVNKCEEKEGQSTLFIEKFDSFDDYKASCTVSIDGCQIDTCSGPAATCGTDGKTGEFACIGTGTFTGDPSVGTETPATTPAPPVPEPTTTDQSQSCTPPSVNGSTTTYTCVTESNATEFANSNCAVGTVNGVQGLHCTEPAYVPEHDSKKREDQVSEVTNPDGSKTTTTTSTTTTTHCAAGACNTTTNVTTTTSGKDANGNPTGTTTTCKGDNCDNPTTPGKDESEEEGDDEAAAAPFNPTDKGDYLPQIGGGEEVPTYAESLDDFTDRVSNAPIVRGLTSITVPSGGSCSIGSAQLFGGSVSFEDFCTMAPQVLAGLRYLFLAIWAWAAIRLFFTA